VEIITGLLFLLISNIQYPISNQLLIFQYPNIPISHVINLIYLLFITSCLIVIFVADLRYFIIPDEIIYLAIGATFIYKFFEAFDFKISDFGFRIFSPFGLSILAALGASLFFFVIVVATRGKGMGLGDVKLAFLMGLVLGWPKIVPALLLAFISGALVGLALIILGRAKMKSEIPFGTFLSVSTFSMLFWGGAVFSWYLNFLF